MSNNNCDVPNKKHIDSQIYVDLRILIPHNPHGWISYRLKIHIDSMIRKSSDVVPYGFVNLYGFHQYRSVNI